MNTRSRWWQWGPTDAAPFVLLHSLGLDGGSFQWLAEQLVAQCGLRVIAPDLRGHGAFEAAPASISIPQMAEDVIADLDALGIAHAHLLGTSMGSVVARFAARIAPARWHSVTLVAGAAQAIPALAERGTVALAQGMAAEVQPTLERWFSEPSLANNDAFVRYARTCLLTMAPEPWAASWRALSDYPPPGALPRGVVSLCVAGELDVSAPAAALQQLRDAAGVVPAVEIVAGGPHQLAMTHAAALARVLQARLPLA